MIVLDWRDVPAADIAALYALERERWLASLAWDPSPSHAIVEAGRLAGYVPGFVALDSRSRASGWTYFILHDGVLQIGGLSAARPSVARALIDAVLDSPESRVARSLSCFLLPGCRGVGSAFARQRFAIADTVYLLRDNDPATPGCVAGDALVRPWREDDLPAVVRLLASAYENVPGASCFAPAGRRDEWAHYVAQLVRTPACGELDASLSFVIPSEDGYGLDAAVLTTRIGPGAAHIAQLAVSPGCRRGGYGGMLASRAAAAAAASGLNRTTLMVHADNAAARELYARLGFREAARFLYGRRSARTRMVA